MQAGQNIKKGIITLDVIAFACTMITTTITG